MFIAKPNVLPLKSHWSCLVLLTLLVAACVRQPEDVGATDVVEDHVSEDPVQLLEVVEHGTVEELTLALRAGVDVNAAGHRGTTALMRAIQSRNLDKMKLLIEHGADAELTDDYNNTPLKRAVEMDFPEGVEYLFQLGVDRGYQPKYPLKKIDYDGIFDGILDKVEIPPELEGIMTAEKLKESLGNSREMMREMLENLRPDPCIRHVQSVTVLKRFLEQGDEIGLAPNDVRCSLLGLGGEERLNCARADYFAHKSPQFGNANPQRQDHRFWNEMIRTGANSYLPREQFNDAAFVNPGVVWCNDRFGSTLTPLPEGRFVQIGGEHEDHYDPDFYIYNDVILFDGQGGFAVYGYPRDAFPPTDFHTASLVGDDIYIIGGLGYPDDRKEGFTPVYRLDLESLKMEAVATTGEMPGWIHGHRAHYDAERNVITVVGGETHIAGVEGELDTIPNECTFELDMPHLHWRKIQ